MSNDFIVGSKNDPFPKMDKNEHIIEQLARYKTALFLEQTRSQSQMEDDAKKIAYLTALLKQAEEALEPFAGQWPDHFDKSGDDICCECGALFPCKVIKAKDTVANIRKELGRE